MSAIDPARMSRRSWLRRASATAVALAAGRRAGAASIPPAATQPQNSRDDPAAVTVPRSTVVEAVSEHVLTGPGVRLAMLEDMLAGSLRRLTGVERIEDAWHRILRPDDLIGVKFNQRGAAALGTTAPVARVLIESLSRAGFDPARIVLIEPDDETRRTFKTQPADLRFPEATVDFGCGQDSFVAALEQVTAIINVPFFKTHHLAGMTGCLKNLSHGLIRRPAQFHANGCDPAIGRIVASAPLRSRIRLHLVNALRVVVGESSRITARDVAVAGRLVLSRDPVAADATGYELINRARRERRLPPLLPLPRIPRYLVTARELGLGEFDPDGINRVEWTL